MTPSLTQDFHFADHFSPKTFLPLWLFGAVFRLYRGQFFSSPILGHFTPLTALAFVFGLRAMLSYNLTNRWEAPDALSPRTNQPLRSWAIEQWNNRVRLSYYYVLFPLSPVKRALDGGRLKKEQKKRRSGSLNLTRPSGTCPKCQSKLGEWGACLWKCISFALAYGSDSERHELLQIYG